jgi:glucokinase-like ROK family protein
LLFAPNLKWSNVPLRDRWQERFGVPVMVENDANASALGEQMLGVAKQVDNFVYLSAGVGLGGGVIIGGKLYGGVGGFAGEVGHMTLEPDGPPCNCGNRGCWETLVGPVAIVQQVRRAAAQGRAPTLLALGEVNGNVNAIRLEHVLHAAAQGEPAVLDALDKVGRYLGIGIANLINTFNPSLVVLGGALSLAGPYILPRAQQEVDVRALAVVRQGVQITLSAFRFDACVIGGVTLILREILSNPTAWRPLPIPASPQQERATFAPSVL